MQFYDLMWKCFLKRNLATARLINLFNIVKLNSVLYLEKQFHLLSSLKLAGTVSPFGVDFIKQYHI